MYGNVWAKDVILRTDGAPPPLSPPETLLQPENQSEMCTADWVWPAKTTEATSPIHPKTERQVWRKTVIL